MNPNPTAAPTAAPAPPTGTTGTTGVEERLRHLFRASLKMGLVHPLHLPLLQYRQHKARG